MAQTEVLFIADDLNSINVAWRHFAYSDYSVRATTLVESGMECFEGTRVPQVVVYYCNAASKNLINLYRTIREDPRSANVPLIVLADFQEQKTLLEYFKLENTYVVGISIDDSKLKEIVRKAVRKR